MMSYCEIGNASDVRVYEHVDGLACMASGGFHPFITKSTSEMIRHLAEHIVRHERVPLRVLRNVDERKELMDNNMNAKPKP